jgi:hypothetical protein
MKLHLTIIVFILLMGRFYFDNMSIIAPSPVLLNKTYVDTESKISFSYPSNWNLEGDSINQGTLQLYNFPKEKNEGSISKKGQSKIEIVYLSSTANPPSVTNEFFYISDKRVTKNTGESYINYLVKSPHNSNYLSFTIYGDLANIYILENIIKSLEW